MFSLVGKPKYLLTRCLRRQRKRYFVVDWVSSVTADVSHSCREANHQMCWSENGIPLLFSASDQVFTVFTYLSYANTPKSRKSPCVLFNFAAGSFEGPWPARSSQKEPPRGMNIPWLFGAVFYMLSIWFHRQTCK